jgi:hypothetical protein
MQDPSMCQDAPHTIVAFLRGQATTSAQVDTLNITFWLGGPFAISIIYIHKEFYIAFYVGI